MEYILTILVVIVIIVFFFYASKKGEKMLKDQKNKIDAANKAKATILGISQGSMRGSGDHGLYQVYVFKLNVTPEYGKSYKAQTEWKVYPMSIPNLQPGMEVHVKIDANDESVIYPSMQWVEYSFSTNLNRKK